MVEKILTHKRRQSYTDADCFGLYTPDANRVAPKKAEIQHRAGDVLRHDSYLHITKLMDE
jgi:hypothetical protein